MRLAENFYRTIFENMNTVVLILDPETTEILDANQAACTFYGFSDEELCGKKFSDFHSFAFEQVENILNLETTTDKGYATFQQRLSNGDIRDVEVYSCPMEVNGKKLLLSIIHNFSEQKCAEQPFRKLSQIVEQNPASVVITDPYGTVEYINPKFKELTGYSFDEIIGKDIRQINLGISSTQYKKIWKTITSGAAWQGIYRNRKKNGEEYWGDVTISPILDKKGIITHFSITLVDITERKAAEEALDRERRLLRTVIDMIPDQVFAHDLNSRFILNNLCDAQVMGVTDPSVLLGKSDFDFYPPELAESYQRNDRLVMESNQPLNVREESSMLKETGKKRWVNTVKVPLQDAKGKVIGVVGIARDITESKTAEEALKASVERYRNLFEEAIEGIVQSTVDGKYIDANQSYIRIFGYKSKDDLFQSVNNIGTQIYADPEDRRKLLELLAENDRVENYIGQAIRKDGQKIWVSMNVSVIRNPDGEISHFDSRLMDITEQKKAEEEIAVANEKLISWVNDLEQRNQEADVLRQMGDMLQLANEHQEYYSIVKEYIPSLFPGTSGALFIANNPLSSIESVAVWGPPLHTENVFKLNECWAFRRSQVHIGKSSSPGLNCRHIHETYSGNYLEIPLLASGEMLGSLYIEGEENNFSPEKSNELGRRLAEHLSLSLANLRLRETLRSQSIRDALTGLFNRRYMEETLAREFPRAARKKAPVGIIVLDIDYFKKFNDFYGHDAGDLVLKKLAALLQSQIRSEDIVCRFGGEEFILILPDANLEVTVKRAEKIREAIKAMKLEYGEQALGLITASLGVAICPTHSETAEGIIKKADKALYQAKHNGRDRVEVAEIDP